MVTRQLQLYKLNVREKASRLLNRRAPARSHFSAKFFHYMASDAPPAITVDKQNSNKRPAPLEKSRTQNASILRWSPCCGEVVEQMEVVVPPTEKAVPDPLRPAPDPLEAGKGASAPKETLYPIIYWINAIQSTERSVGGTSDERKTQHPSDANHGG